MNEKTQKYQIVSRVKIGSEYFAPESGEALFMDLDDKVGQSLVDQGAAVLVKVAKVAKAETKADEKGSENADKK